MSATTHGDSVGHDEQKTNPIRARRRHRYILMSGGALFLIALVGGFVPQFRQRQIATVDTKELAIPTVAVASPTITTPGSGLNLPAEVKPWQEASVFARVNGYLKDWLVDIGAHVQKDQLLAEIDTPDFEQAKKTNTKWQELYKEGVVSQLDAENTDTSQGTNKANTEAFAANLRFLEQEVAFKRVTAPFPGIITVRNVNVGDLITANNTNMEMFHIQQTDPLRVYFRIPQEDAANIAVGQTFDVQVGAQSAKTYPGKVVSTSEAVSPDSRTMLVELQVDNAKNEILPGSYATVRVPQVALGKLVTLPDNTLIFRDKSVQVGVVDAKGVVQLRDVTVGRDFGVQSEILSGVTQSDKVIVNPSDSLTTGTTVRLAATPGPSAMPAASAKSDASAAATASVTAAPSAAPAVSAAPTASTTSGSSATPVPSATPIPSPTQR